MISNRIDKLKRNCNNYGDIMELLNSVEKGQNVTEFINTFTTNKTHFFREEFHFEDLRDRVLPAFSKNKENISHLVLCIFNRRRALFNRYDYI